MAGGFAVRQVQDVHEFPLAAERLAVLWWRRTC
jgi:hypothetical protein